jgi:hypothetical protein
MILGKRQRALLLTALAAHTPKDAVETKLRAQLLDKFAGEPRDTGGGVSVAAVQDALIAASGGRVNPVVTAGPAWWARMAKLLTAKGVTVEGAVQVGTWLAAQTWLTQALTLDTVLYKWEAWYANATAATNAAAAHGKSGVGSRAADAW